MNDSVITKILKYLMIIFTTGYIANKLLFYGVIYIYFHGSATPAIKMEGYKFNTTVENLKKELQTISNKNIYISYQDSVYGDNSGNANTIRIFKGGQKLTYFLRLNEKSDDKNSPVKLNLYFINGKGKDDFGWFSNKKKEQVKLFENNIIDPLSKKFQRIEFKD